MPNPIHNDLFDGKHFNKTELKAKGISKMYAQMVQKIMSRFKIVDLKGDKFFAFDDYAQYKNSMDSLFQAFAQNITAEINKQSKESWKYAEKKNQALLRKTMRRFGMKQRDLGKYKKSNLEALAAFQKRKDSGMMLSDKVWKYTDQFKKEIEMGIDVGLRDGKSAQQIAKDLKQYLQHPDKLFRKVKDKHGNLGLSKAAKAFHPGQGVYRSSMKNAMRVARTENNMAYHEANFQKYNDFDFVIGIEVKLSNNPNHCPFCDAMKGKYPKEFKFTGWHPHCRCTTIPILKTPEEMESDNDRIALRKKVRPSTKEILDVPDNYKQWIKDNEEKLKGMKNKPYWWRANQDFKAKEKPSIGAVTEKILTLKQIGLGVDKNLITEDIFLNDKTWLPERKILHENLINKYLEGEIVEADKVYMLGGAGANGKSSLTDSGKLPHPKGALVIDPDKIKASIPEYQQMLQSGDKYLIGNAANFVHEESSYLSKEIRRRALESKRGTILDGVNNGTAQKIHDNANEIRRLSGKRIRADYVTLDTELSLKLAEMRSIKTGREVPKEVLLKANKSISKEFPGILKNKSFDELYLWDTNINGEPRLILTQIDGEITIYDQELFDRFLKKADFIEN